MTARPDDDALAWDGDDDPTLAVGGAPAVRDSETASAEQTATTLPDGWSAVGKGE